MTLEVVRGAMRDRVMAGALVTSLSGLELDGTLYLGYPVLSGGDRAVSVDAMLVTRQTGLLAIQLRPTPTSESEWEEICDEQNRLFATLQSQLGKQAILRRGRAMILEPETATIFPDEPSAITNTGALEGLYTTLHSFPSQLGNLRALDDDAFTRLQSAIQHVNNMRPKKRRADVERNDSKGALLKQIERSIANLDKWQKEAAIELPEGPQRIRGLAGSGKTVVLAHKAAYLHTTYPEWTIALTFHTRALYQQVESLVERFTIDSIEDTFDPEKLQIMHSWGAGSRAGVYSKIARHAGVSPINWADASRRYGNDNAFAGVCGELLAQIRKQPVDPIFDAILIDEAQDLPPEFFQLVYEVTREPKRVIWAYDEMQRLNETAMPPLSEMFGMFEGGGDRVTLARAANEANPDVVLPVCYRNTPWAITAAHSFGFGIYDEKLTQHFDDPAMWLRIGYRVAEGDLADGRKVALARSEGSIPEYFSRMQPQDAIQFHTYDDQVSLDDALALAIQNNIANDEIDPDDIMIVLPEPRYAKSRANSIRRALKRLDIDCHLVGVDSAVDELVRPGSVSMAHIYRAKGNEAPMVYVLDAELAAERINAITNRNVLFTSITRSRGWVRILASGPLASSVKAEFQGLQDHNYKLEFQIPTEKQRTKMRQVNRERSEEQTRELKATASDASELLKTMANEQVDVNALDHEVLEWLRAQLGKNE